MSAVISTDPNVIDATPAQAMPLAAQPSYQAPAVATPAALVQMAVQNGTSMEQLEKLLALQERWEAGEARKAYTAAMAQAKKAPPTITKDKDVNFETSKGWTSYSHATLGNVVSKVVAWLAEYGFSHAWSTTHIDGGRVAVTCTLTHSMGHSESVTLEASKDDSGGKNNIQALGSAIAYLQRYTVFAITGLASEDQDDDGRSCGANAEAVAEDIANKTYFGLIEDLKKTTTDAAAKALWDAGSKALAATGSKGAYADFKTAVVNHRNALKAAGGAK